MILGIVAVISSFTVVGGVGFGIAAIVTGVMGRRRAKQGRPNSGLAIAGLVLGIVGIVAAALFLVLYIAVADEVSTTAHSITTRGAADPATYAISHESCDIDSSGTATAKGTLENTSDRARTYRVRARFLDDGSLLGIDSDELFIASGKDKDYKISVDVGDVDSVDCEVSVN